MVMKKGATQPVVISRRAAVYRLTVKGFSGSEIARTLQVTERTIRRDLESARKKLSAKVIAQNIRNLTKAMAELEELWTEAWRLYHKDPQVIGVTKTGKEIKEDPTYRRLGSLYRLLQISQEKNRITGLHGPDTLQQIVNVESFTFQGVKITNTIEAEDVIRKRGEEMDKLYAASRPTH